MTTTRRETLAMLASLLSGSALVSARQTGAAPAARPAAKPPSKPVSPKLATVADFEPLAKQRMSHMAYHTCPAAQATS